MAGGTWTTQNKRRPGVYIRFRSEGEPTAAAGERGTAALCEPLSWGPVGVIQTLEAGADPVPATGYAATDPKNRFLTELFKGSDRTAPPKRVLLYRPAATGSASASGGASGSSASSEKSGRTASSSIWSSEASGKRYSSALRNPFRMLRNGIVLSWERP